MNELLFQVDWWNWFYLIFSIFPLFILFKLVLPSLKKKSSPVAKHIGFISLVVSVVSAVPLIQVLVLDYDIHKHSRADNHQVLVGKLLESEIHGDSERVLKFLQAGTQKIVYLEYYDAKNMSRCYKSGLFQAEVFQVDQNFSIKYFYADYLLKREKEYACIFEIRQT